MITKYMIPHSDGNQFGDAIFIDNVDLYRKWLAGALKTDTKLAEYSIDDWIEYDFEYKLKRTRIVSHRAFYQINGFYPTDKWYGESSFERTVYWHYKCNARHYAHKDSRVYDCDYRYILEWLDGDWFTFHRIDKFCRFDFANYYREKQPMFERNIKHWEHLFGRYWVKNQDKKMEHILKKNPVEFAIRLLKKMY